MGQHSVLSILKKFNKSMSAKEISKELGVNVCNINRSLKVLRKNKEIKWVKKRNWYIYRIKEKDEK